MIQESVRTLLYAFCVLGIFFPLFMWIGAAIVMASLGPAPDTTAKKSSYWLGGLAIGLPIFLAVFSMVFVAAGAYTMSAILPMIICPLSVGVSIAFIVVADKTIRQSAGDSENVLSSARYFRGVNLGLNVAGLVFFFPPLNWVGVPLAMTRLSKVQDSVSGYGGVKFSSWAFLILDFACWVTLFALSATSVPRGRYSYYYYSRYTNAWNYYWYFFLIFSFMRFAALIVFLALSDAMTLRWIEQSPASPDAGIVQVGGSGMVVAKVVEQGMVTPTATTANCPSCAAPLQFTPTGASTQVQCYQCQSIVEFTNA